MTLVTDNLVKDVTLAVILHFTFLKYKEIISPENIRINSFKDNSLNISILFDPFSHLYLNIDTKNLTVSKSYNPNNLNPLNYTLPTVKYNVFEQIFLEWKEKVSSNPNLQFIVPKIYTFFRTKGEHFIFLNKDNVQLFLENYI